MTMMDFFRKSEGVWFIQRSVHHFDSTRDESGESNLFVNVLQPDHPRVRAICEQQGVDPRLSPGGASFGWQHSLDDSEPNPNYAAILVDLPDDETGRSGKVLRDRGYVESIAVVCRYQFADDGVLTIDTCYDRSEGQERCWFVNDNFRVRVSTVKMMDGVNLMTYCSEFRCLSPEVLSQMRQRNEAIAAGISP
jgi:CpeS-like protein